MPVVQIYMWKGRTVEQKRKLTEEITKAFESVAGVAPTSLHIIFQDIEKNDWAYAGKLASDD